MTLDYIMQLNEIETIVSILRLYFINLFTYYMNFKIINKSVVNKKWKLPVILVIIFLITIWCEYIKDNFNFVYLVISIIILIGGLFLINTKNKLGYSIMITMISLAINYTVFLLSASLWFLIFFNLNIQNDDINIIVSLLIYAALVFGFTKIKKFKKGFAFLQEKLKNEYLDLLILNISCVVLFTVVIMSNYDQILSGKITMMLVVFAIMMFITIQKSLQLYYKQKMLVKDLEETKEELEDKKKEVAELEKENLEFSKVSHSIAHKQKALEHKLNELSMKNEIADEMDLKDRIENLDADLRKETIVVLDKTGISEIDDMLSYMQSECVKNKIDFQLQLSGNIYTMINHYVSKEELEILLADHIKNAIIAIGYGDNINKSILVRLGKLDGHYGLYVYDSGIEFEINTLLNLGKKPSTTHKDSGGTGMGFMNTFDTLRKHKASFVIEEYGKPVKDNFTKALKFKFDGKNEFKICSYRYEEIRKEDYENTLVVENIYY